MLTGGGSVGVGTASTLTSNGVLVSALTLNAGATHDIRPNGSDTGTSKLNAITLATAGDGSYTATLDLNDNKFILQTDPTVAGDKAGKAVLLQSALGSGEHGGDWLGTGITSSTVAADASATGSHMLTLGLFDNADVGLATFGGQGVDFEFSAD